MVDKGISRRHFIQLLGAAAGVAVATPIFADVFDDLTVSKKRRMTPQLDDIVGLRLNLKGDKIAYTRVNPETKDDEIYTMPITGCEGGEFLVKGFSPDWTKHYGEEIIVYNTNDPTANPPKNVSGTTNTNTQARPFPEENGVDTIHDENIWMIDPKTGNKAPLIHGDSSDQRDPSCAVELKRVAFSTEEYGSPRIKIWDSKRRKHALIPSNGGSDYNPSMSQDGNRVCFEKWNNGRSQIWMYDLNSGKMYNLTEKLGGSNYNVQTDNNNRDFITFVNDKGPKHSKQVYALQLSGTKGKVFKLTHSDYNKKSPCPDFKNKRLYYISTEPDRGGLCGKVYGASLVLNDKVADVDLNKAIKDTKKWEKVPTLRKTYIHQPVKTSTPVKKESEPVKEGYSLSDIFKKQKELNEKHTELDQKTKNLKKKIFQKLYDKNK